MKWEKRCHYFHQTHHLIETVVCLEKRTPLYIFTGLTKYIPLRHSETNCAIQWIVIYPVDSAIQLLNNWGLSEKRLEPS